MSRPVIFITGANAGLGYEMVRALCDSTIAYDILLGGRSMGKVDAAVASLRSEFPQTGSVLTGIHIDIEDDESIARSAASIAASHGRLDALVNNAGTQLDQQLAAGKLGAREMWNQTWNVNTTSTHLVTSACAPLLLQAAKPYLLFLTSGTATLAESDNQAIFVNRYAPKGWPKPAMSGGIPAYRAAKTGMNMMARHWERLLHEDGVKVFCVSPGQLATGLGGSVEANKKAGAQDPALGAHFVRDVLEGKRDADAGLAVRRAGVQPW